MTGKKGKKPGMEAGLDPMQFVSFRIATQTIESPSRAIAPVNAGCLVCEKNDINSDRHITPMVLH